MGRPHLSSGRESRSAIFEEIAGPRSDQNEVIDADHRRRSFKQTGTSSRRTAARPNCAQAPCAKVAAATAVMSLVQEGEINLNQPVLQYDSNLVFANPAAAR